MVVLAYIWCMNCEDTRIPKGKGSKQCTETPLFYLYWIYGRKRQWNCVYTNEPLKLIQQKERKQEYHST